MGSNSDKSLHTSPSGAPGGAAGGAESSTDKLSVDRARNRLAWLRSSEHKRFLRSIWLIAATVVLAIAAGYGWAKVNFQPGSYGSAPYLTDIGVGIFIWAYVALPLCLLRYSQLRREFRNRTLLGDAYAELLRAEDDIAHSGNTDFISLWNVTQKRLDYYHKIATTHAERSFLYGQIAAITGFLIILVAVILSAFAHSVAASIGTAVAGLSGGGLGAYIGATFMRSQDVASLQLREYFHQPLEFSKYLAAERLLESLGRRRRDTAVLKIIESITKPESNKIEPHKTKLLVYHN